MQFPLVCLGRDACLLPWYVRMFSSVMVVAGALAPVAGTLAREPAGGQAPFAVTASLTGGKVQLRRVEPDAAKGIVATKEAVLEAGEFGLPGGGLRHAAISPGGQWIALGASGETQRCVAILSSEDLEARDWLREPLGRSLRWFWWEGASTLGLHRLLPGTGPKGGMVDLYSMSAPEWSQGLRRASMGPVALGGLAMGADAGLGRRRDDAARAMFRLGYLGPMMSSLAEGAVVGGWRSHFNGQHAEVSRDGRMIAALTYLESRKRNVLLLLSSRARKWSVVGQWEVPSLWLVQFWSGRLVVGVADLEKVKGHDSVPSRYVERRRRVWFIGTGGGRWLAEVPADIFAASGE